MEVLLVAGILALLAAFAIPKLFDTAQQARMKIAEAAIGPSGPIATALDHYKYDMGKYPDTDEGLAALLKPKNQVDDERYNGPYLGNDKLEDPWGKPYEYRSPGDVHEEGFDLWSRGPDGKDNSGKEGSDDIKNWIEK
jgi:general secretion pathway protein G